MRFSRAAGRVSLLALACLAAFLPMAAATPSPLRWYYPMDKAAERSTVKPFGIIVDDAFYKGKEALFPTRFKGIHSGADFETFADEKADAALVPVYAVTSGTVAFIGNLPGYGGLVLVRLDDGVHVALYGHVKPPPGLAAGDRVAAGQALTYLGNDFSPETAGERKHLHFGIHRGTDNYFRGHEASEKALRAMWEDPMLFLSAKGAWEPGAR